MLDYIENYLSALKTQKIYRSLKSYSNDFVDFSSNDYLGLSYNEASIKAGFKAAQYYGSGSTGSRLLSGNKEIFEIFEKQIAFDKKFKAALIFNCGFIANACIISALCIPQTVVIFDKLNHASIYYGLNSSPAKLVRYPHLQYDKLEEILKKECGSYKNRVVVSETVFGMDGDMADLDALLYLSKKYNTMLFLDEAHATGLYGKNGCGLSTDYVWDPSSTIIMGTFSKALSSSGAYVVCNKLMREYLVQKCKGFIYSTALSPFCIGVAQYNWNLLKTMTNTRMRLLLLAQKFVEYSGTNIISVVFRCVDEMFYVHNKLLEHKIVTSAIRPPTSPTPRIRFAINATHTEEDVLRLLEVLKK
ncbi:MAG: aminotransferase class I/II-fold pyridoxal phosphate-dependent enzyme [Coxiellaceae bacterium]|jgi:8-amino-7-oxononanoate synthase|nr:aminotransferase class I/II-fold pyridoxal phosphate-dependent enzyme [Coxiellaceae bacterium]